MSLTTFVPPELQRFTRAFEELFYVGDPVPMTSYYTEDTQLMADAAHPGSRRDHRVLARRHHPGHGGQGPAHHPPPRIALLR
jgi:hypothetical protein